MPTAQVARGVVACEGPSIQDVIGSVRKMALPRRWKGLERRSSEQSSGQSSEGVAVAGTCELLAGEPGSAAMADVGGATAGG